MVSNSPVLQTVNYDESTESMGGDSETNTTVASSPGFDISLNKTSPLLLESVENNCEMKTDHSSGNFRKDACRVPTSFVSTRSTFPSPGSAFTELHPKQSRLHINRQSSANRLDSNSSSNSDENQMGLDVNLKVGLVCRICGRSHDLTSPHIYDYTQAVDADLCCTLCHEPLVDPLDTKCGHTFCSPCLKNHLAVQALCPVDRQIINYLECQQASNIVKKLLDKLLVACPNKRYCTAVVYRNSLEEHLREWCPCTHTVIPNSNLQFQPTQPTLNYQHQPPSKQWKHGYVPPTTTTNNFILMTSGDFVNSMNFNAAIDVSYSTNHVESTFANRNVDHLSHQYSKEFPHLFPPNSRHVQCRNHQVPNPDTNQATINSPVIYEGVPVSIILYRQNDCMDLGFTFVGGLDTPLACILIQEIYLDGPAALDGRLRPGDQLLEINGHLLTHVAHLEAKRLLSTPSPMVQLAVFREPMVSNLKHQQQQQHTPPRYHDEIFTVKLCKRQGKVLGIKLVGKKHVPGLYVLELVSGCEADLDGRMRKDDQILEINSIDLLNGTQEQAAQIINSVSDCVVFKLRRRNRSETPDILRTTSRDMIDDKSDLTTTTSLLPLDSLHLVDEQHQSSSPTMSQQHGAWGDQSSYMSSSASSSNAQSTTELIQQSTLDCKSTELDEKNVSVGAGTSPGGVRCSQMAFGMKQVETDQEACGQERTVSVGKSLEEPLGISIAGGRHSQRGDTPIYVTNISTECVLGRSKQFPLSERFMANICQQIEIWYWDGTRIRAHPATSLAFWVQRGDVLLEANGVNLIGLTHHEAVEVLRQISLYQTQVQLRLITSPETSVGPTNFMPSWMYWLRLPPGCHMSRTIRLKRNSLDQQPLGFSIVGGLGHDDTASNNSSHQWETNVQPSPDSTEDAKQSKSRAFDPYRSCPIVIKSIVPGLLAHKDGRLKCGDLILAVNNISMLNVTHSQAVRMLKHTRGDIVLQIISWPGTIV